MKRSIYLLGLTILAFSITACSSSKKATADQSTSKDKQKKEEKAYHFNDDTPRPIEHKLMEEEAGEVDNTTTTPKVEEQLPNEGKMIRNRVNKGLADSVFARIERTPCFGRCPIYHLTIYDGGYAVYHGERFVQRLGTYEASFKQEKLQALKAKADEINYWSLKDSYDQQISDIPTTIVTVKGEEGFKTVVDRWEAPEELHQFEEFFDALFKEADWKKIGE